MIQIKALFYLVFLLIVLFPNRINNLFVHVFISPFKVIKKAQLNYKKCKPSKLQIVLAWSLGLIIRILDVVTFWSLIEFLSTLFKWKTRSLSNIEKENILSILGENIHFDAIKINESSFLAKFGAKNIGSKHLGFVFGHTINFSRKLDENSNLDMAWLIHETVHVSQFEKMGFSYTMEALYAQNKWGYAYSHLLKNEFQKLSDFNLEQQGDIARDYFLNSNSDLVELVNQIRLKQF